MSSQRSPRGQGHLRREQLLDAAEELLDAGRSEDEISVASIVGAVGVTQPVLYRFFDDKTALFTEVHRRRFADFGEQIEGEAAQGSDALDRLVRRGCAYVRIAVEEPDAYRRLFIDPNGIAARVYRPTSLPADHPERTPFSDLVDNVAALTATHPHPRFDTDIELARAIWALVHGIATLAITVDQWNDDQLDDLTATSIVSLLSGGASTTQ